ncbi:MAG: hypothetical protein H7274_20145 [Rhodoferax sp.]|nr:hypothetical protein [Rhodoferax sp.]
MNLAGTTLSPALNPVPSVPVPWRDMLSHRDALVRFAKARLHDPMLAEDVVHGVFEALLSGHAAFAGRAALRSWLTAILKHPIVDLVRQRAGTDNQDDDNQDERALPMLSRKTLTPRKSASQCYW